MKKYIHIPQFYLTLSFSVLSILICSLSTSTVSAQFAQGIVSLSARNIELAMETALSAYVELGDIERVREVLDAGANPNGPDQYSEERRDCFGLFRPNPVHCAAYIGDVEITRILIEAGANVNVSGAECSSPLQAAISYNHPEIFDMILNADNFDINYSECSNGYLKAAIRKRNGRAIKVLLGKGAKVDVLRDDYYAAMINILRSYETSLNPPLEQN